MRGIVNPAVGCGALWTGKRTGGRWVGTVAVAAVAMVLVVSGGGVPVARAGYEDCSLKALKACANMNELIWAKDFKPALKAFIGDHPRWYRDLVSALGGVWVKDKARWLGPDLVRFAACMFHNCGLKGAVFLTADGRILQAAVINTPCSGSGCGSKNVVYVLTHNPDPALVRLAREWAIEALDIDPRTGRSPSGQTLEWVQVVDLECVCTRARSRALRR